MNLSTRRAASTRIELALAVGLVALVQGILLAQVAEYSLMGWDTFPQIESSRIESWADFLGTFSEETADGVHQSSFYRPVFNLSLASDYALWGIEPFGYHLTDALLGAACAFSIFGVSRRLLGPDARAGRWIALITFLLLPVHVEVLPLVSRRMDMICGLFVALALYAQAHRLNAPFGVRSAWPAIFTLLAVGAKETGLVAAPLVLAMSLLAAPALPPRAHWGRALRVAAPHFLAVAVVFAARFAALGQLGGHGSTALSGGITRLPWSTGLLAVRLSSAVEGSAYPLRAPWLAVLGAILLWAVAHVWLIVIVRRGVGRPGSGAPEPAALRRATATMLLAATWLVLIAFVYAVNGFIHPWYLLMPGLALALLLAGFAETLKLGAHSRPRSVIAAGALLLLLSIGLQARWSPILHEYAYWDRGHLTLDSYLNGLVRGIESAEDGDVITLFPPPVSLRADPNPLGSTRATILHVYSLQPWAKLRFPERHIEFRHRKLNDSTSDPIADGVVVLLQGRRRARAARVAPVEGAAQDEGVEPGEPAQQTE